MATLKQVIASDPELAALAAAGDYSAVAAALNTVEMTANPEPQEQTPRRIGMLDVFNAIATAAPADLAKAGAVPGWMIDRAEECMHANDRLGMGNWLVSIGAVAGLSAAAKGALSALLAQTEADPDWTATVPGAARWQSAGLTGPVIAAAVQEAVHATPD